MKWVITFLFSCLVLLVVAVMLSACGLQVSHHIRCRGDCDSTLSRDIDWEALSDMYKAKSGKPVPVPPVPESVIIKEKTE